MSAPRHAHDHLLVSIVVPAFNEADVLRDTWQRLNEIMTGTPFRTEIIFVNDGSTDATEQILSEIHEQSKNVISIHLSRNFGKEYALTAGLDFAGGDAVIMIDADLQDPPELIPEMIRQWRKGSDVINMRRLSRTGETWLKKATAKSFYRIMGRIGPVRMPADVGDFRLLSRRAVDALRQMPERTRVMKGLFAWIGFPTMEIGYHRDSRRAGKTKWGYIRLWNLALESITSSTVAPLKAAGYVGIFTALAAFVYGLFVVVKTLVHGDPVPGYPSLMVIILFLGGLQLFAIGLVGEYLGRMFIETKRRPLYLVKRHHMAAEAVSVTLSMQEKQS